MSVYLCIYNVGRGLCVAIETPKNYLCMIDCGCSDDTSLILHLKKTAFTELNGHKLAKLIITHPHLDHIADIQNVTEHMPPAIILRRKDLDRGKVTGGGSGQSPIFNHYEEHYMPPQYDCPANEPDWGDGLEFKSWCLDPSKAAEISNTDSSYVNNTSLVTIMTYRGYRFVFPGDIESEGMAALLEQQPDLRGTIKQGIHFYLTPHHGHPSGFSKEWFGVAGPTIIANIASERRKRTGEDESQTRVDTRYSQCQYCRGENPQGRRLISTKRDGTIGILIDDEDTWRWNINAA